MVIPAEVSTLYVDFPWTNWTLRSNGLTASSVPTSSSLRPRRMRNPRRARITLAFPLLHSLVRLPSAMPTNPQPTVKHRAAAPVPAPTPAHTRATPRLPKLRVPPHPRLLAPSLWRLQPGEFWAPLLLVVLPFCR